MRAVVAQYGDTVVLNAVTTGPGRPGIDFFPLTCDYRERTAAAGKFPGGFIKREGRPTTKETLTSRLCDRPIRPLFPKGFRDEVQCQSIVLASDKQNDARRARHERHRRGAVHLAAAVSAARSPRSASAASNGQFVAFPTHDELEESDLDLIVSGTETVGRDDRRLRPRNARRPTCSRRSSSPTARFSEIIAPAARVARRRSASQKPAFVAPPDTGRLRPPEEPLLRRVQGRQANHRQAGPGRRGQGRQGQGRRRVHSRSAGRRTRSSPRSSAPPGTIWKSGSSAT